MLCSCIAFCLTGDAVFYCRREEPYLCLLYVCLNFEDCRLQELSASPALVIDNISVQELTEYILLSNLCMVYSLLVFSSCYAAYKSSADTHEV